MVRVLHVLSAPAAGGAEIYVRDLAKAQKAMGAFPHIAFLESASDIGRDTQFEKAYLKDLQDAEIPYFIIGKGCRRNLLKGLVSIARYCRRHAITHYHSHLVYGLFFGAFLSIPRLFTEHSHRVRGARVLRRYLNQFVESYIAISKKCAEAVEQVVKRPTTVIFNGVDTVRMVRRSSPGCVIRPLKLLSVGRICKPKNYPLLIESLGRLEGSIGERYVVEIAGDGAPDVIAALEAQAAAAGVAHRVQFLGNRTDIAELMASSDLLVMSSAWEGLPIVLLEAVVAQLPFVATDVGGCGEVVDITGAGVVVPPNDPDALADTLRELITDHKRRRKMREAAAKHASYFSIEHAAQAHLELYQQTVRS